MKISSFLAFTYVFRSELYFKSGSNKLCPFIDLIQRYSFSDGSISVFVLEQISKVLGSTSTPKLLKKGSTQRMQTYVNVPKFSKWCQLPRNTFWPFDVNIFPFSYNVSQVSFSVILLTDKETQIKKPKLHHPARYQTNRQTQPKGKAQFLCRGKCQKTHNLLYKLHHFVPKMYNSR